MADKYIGLVNNRRTEVEATVTSAGAANAGDIPALDSGGKLDVSVLPTGIGADVVVLPSSENLVAGDLVNIWDDAGTAKVRKADASTASAGKIAHGFVLENVTSPADATVYFEGSNDEKTGLTPGTTYALSHTVPGGVVALASATSTAGHSLQVVGVAANATTLNVEIEQPIIRA
jgi:hypothetical protein